MLQVLKETEAYLKPTELCDCDTNEIMNKAKELSLDAKSSIEAAINIFNFVRDEITFKFDFPSVKASETLQKGYGFCVTKTNLQVALLRAIKIPSRYHQVKLHKDVLKGILADSIHKKMDEIIWYHPWCECNCSGKWVACDSMFDTALYETACHKGIIDKEKILTIDWDGESDLHFVSSWVVEDAGTHESYDDICTQVMDELKMPKFLFKMMVLNKLNRHLQKIRMK
jgi:hypothetical protein